MSDEEFYDKAYKEIVDAVRELRQRGYKIDYPSYIEITKS